MMQKDTEMPKMNTSGARTQGLRLSILSVLPVLVLSACGQAEDSTGVEQAAPETTAEVATNDQSAQITDGETGVVVAEHAVLPDNPTAVFEPGTDFVIGYNNTPVLPDGKWRVHDPERPRPEAVEAGSGIFAAPPSDATVLFDGTDLSNWRLANEGAPQWVIAGDAMRVPSHIADRVGADIMTRQEFGDMQLHIEWRSPPEVVSGSQGRGNSGIFLMGRYEVQVLDSYQNKTYADGQASAIYGWKPPLVNATLPSGEWQSYDIVFEAPRFDEEGALESPAFVTVFHNGVLTQYRQNFLGISGHQNILPYEPHAPKGPLRLQDHGNPVEFRNIWVRELDLASND